jgi:hypothetical protein
VRRALALAALLAASPLAAQGTADSIHTKVQRTRLDSVAAQLSLNCASSTASAGLCAQRARLDSARTLEVFVTPGIVILPGQSIQAAVNAAPTNTTFILKTGTHAAQSVTPKNGDKFRGEVGTVMDGMGSTQFAFRGYNGSAWVNDVQIRNMRITGYVPPAQNAPIWGGNDIQNGTERWVLDSLDVSYNGNIGIRIGNHMQVLRTNTHHNGTMGIGGVAIGAVVDNIESAYNNNGCVNPPDFESGGSKFVLTDSLIVRNSFWHHNCGPGLWLDISNVHWLLEGNRTEYNVREGIAIEISFAGIIRNNAVRRNGWPTDPYRQNGWLWDAGIAMQASEGVEVYGNTLVENFNGIVIVQQTRNASTGDIYAPSGGYIARNNFIHDNVVYQRTLAPGGDGSVSGAATDIVGNTAFFTSQNNRWVNNTYYLGTTNTRPFAWQFGYRTAAEWRAYGQDVSGTFLP